ncbi:hypothetical protein lacNasYZ03_00340 [Lactobacillus nasalidis]|uniref:G5 domain-containing protein n=1 Tax=Lactobacillus nasalidis TaxID=2797258 RepID=A0ABQ3W617_9LACO|nr:G5 domain-containing protein [Lactobacillus nasalidis]GHV98520.1 hypothetical protein lacNasYZ01_17020 [Lactobacillus nasalidis]GHW00015.1 hypothetical protein lacNasYZ02_14440 [Lactobacillus nasalidis]GHW00347.1 hypothetical protein lacNasYZ03_00340 [Lactobacillus nasalidis]
MKVAKIFIGVSASVALITAGMQIAGTAQVQAAAKYQVRVSKKAYIFTSKGKKTKKFYKKNASLQVYGTKWIKGKLYYKISGDKYVLTSYAKKVASRYTYSSQTKRITRTIKMYQPKGVKTVVQNAYVSRKVKTDTKNNKKSYGKWSTSSWAQYTVATVDGYTASQVTVKAAKVTSKTKNKMVKISYKAVETKNTDESKTTNSSSTSTNTVKNTSKADSIKTEIVPFKTIYKADPTMESGTRKLITLGQNGIDIVTTTYAPDGKTYGLSVNPIEEKIDQVVAIGTKPITQYTVKPYNTIRKNDPTLPKGTTRVEKKGVDGWTTSTQTFSVNSETGEVKSGYTVEVQNPVDEVILVGTKGVN